MYGFELTIPGSEIPVLQCAEIPHLEIVVNFIIDQRITIDADLKVGFLFFFHQDFALIWDHSLNDFETP